MPLLFHRFTDTDSEQRQNNYWPSRAEAAHKHTGMCKHELGNEIHSNKALMSIVTMYKLRLYAIIGTRSLNMLAQERELMRVVDT